MPGNVKDDFRALQKRFAKYLRAPAQREFSEGIEPRRLKIYQDLISNNLRSFLNSAFPVAVKTLGSEAWEQLTGQFQASYHCTSPYFTDISAAFVEYIQSLSNQECIDYPYVKELVQYERLEVDIKLMQKPDVTMRMDTTELASLPVRMNPTARVLSYQYPVHQIGESYQPQAAADEATQLVVYKNTSDKVCFVALNPMTAMLLNYLQQQGPISIEALTKLMKRALPNLPEAQVTAGLAQTLQAFCTNELVLRG